MGLLDALNSPGGGGGGTDNNGQYGEAPPERGTFFRLQVYERVGILLVGVYERVGKSVIWVCERAQKGRTIFVIDSCLNDNAFTS